MTNVTYSENSLTTVYDRLNLAQGWPMKRIDDQTVIETIADCLRKNAALSVGEQKDPVATAKAVADAFAALEEKLEEANRPRQSGRTRPVSRASR